MASKCVREAYPLLLVLAKSINKNKKLREELLKNQKVLDSLRELTVNVLHETVPISQSARKRLLQFRKELVLLAEKGRYRKKYAVLKGSQRGGALLSTLLGVGIPILADLLFSHGGSNSR
jgi:hypothetical protein